MANEITAETKPWHLDVMDRLLAGHAQSDIAKDLNLSPSYLSVVVNSPLFQAELNKRREVALKHVTERLEGYAQEALDKVVEKMRSSKQDSIQLAAAREILDRSGYSKPNDAKGTVEDAESVIKALAEMRKNADEGQKRTSSDNAGTHEAGSGESVEHDRDGAGMDAGRSGHESADKTISEEQVD